MFSGDIAFRFLKYLQNLESDVNSEQSHVTVFDINQAMLDVGQARAEKLNLVKNGNISWMCGNAEELTEIKDNSYNAYTIAFGIRNVTNIDKVY